MKTEFSLRALLIRQLIILAMSVFFVLGFAYGKGDELLDANRNLGLTIFSNFVFISLIWNGNLWVLGLIDKRVKWETQPALRLGLSVGIAILLPILIQVLYNQLLFPLIHGLDCRLLEKEKWYSLIISIVITLMINAIIVSLEFFQHWKKTLTEKEELKRNNIAAEFESLKNQINPHFLFNSLNTLTSLIEEQPKTATRFVENLASVYRYLLSQREKETVSLKEELEFLSAYVYLNQIRFGENLKVQIQVPEMEQNKQLVTLTLQLLMENAIKHNVISKDKPLLIEIGVKDERLFIRNSLQPKRILRESNGVGLGNIVNRYRFFTKDEVLIQSGNGFFEVRVPLLKN